LAHLDYRACQLPGALRDLLAAHERVAEIHGHVMPRVTVAMGEQVIFDSAAPTTPPSRKQRYVAFARTLVRRWTGDAGTRRIGHWRLASEAARAQSNTAAAGERGDGEPAPEARGIARPASPAAAGSRRR